jgi:hypothetical protein
MRRKVFHPILFCAFGVALLLTLGMRFQSPPTPLEDATIKFSFKPFPLSPISTPELPPADQIEEPRATEPVPDAISKQKQALKPELISTTYEVTAYYLNVRANSDRKSKILHVIKEGTLIDVITQTDNGWLRIKEGGFVHGGYARKVIGEPKVAEQEEPLTGRKALAGNVLRPQGNADPNPSKPTSTVETDSGLSEADIALIFDGTALAGKGLEGTILEVEKQYGINALFTIAVMKLESGNGSSRLAKSKNNLFGLNAISGDKNNRAFSFETKGDSVRKFGQLLSENYVGKGYTTVERIAKKYCPANSEWSGLVKNIMKKDYGRLNAI